MGDAVGRKRMVDGEVHHPHRVLSETQKDAGAVAHRQAVDQHRIRQRSADIEVDHKAVLANGADILGLDEERLRLPGHKWIAGILDVGQRDITGGGHIDGGAGDVVQQHPPADFSVHLVDIAIYECGIDQLAGIGAEIERHLAVAAVLIVDGGEI